MESFAACVWVKLLTSVGPEKCPGVIRGRLLSIYTSVLLGGLSFEFWNFCLPHNFFVQRAPPALLFHTHVLPQHNRSGTLEQISLRIFWRLLPKTLNTIYKNAYLPGMRTILPQRLVPRQLLRLAPLRDKKLIHHLRILSPATSFSRTLSKSYSPAVPCGKLTVSWLKQVTGGSEP